MNYPLVFRLLSGILYALAAFSTGGVAQTLWLRHRSREALRE